MNHLAFYQPEEGKVPDMRDYMEELQVFVREPLIIVHELFCTFWEQGILGDHHKIEAAMGTLWSCLLRWEGLNEYFENEWRRAKGIKRPCFPKSSEERRLLQNIEIRSGLLPDHMKGWLKLSLFSVEEQKLFNSILKVALKDQEAKENAQETSEEAIEYAEAVMAA